MYVYIEVREQYWVLYVLFLHLIFWDRASYWSWDSLTGWPGWPVHSRIHPSLLPKTLRLQTYVPPCPTFIWMQGFMPRSSSLYSWRFIKGLFPSPEIPSYWPHYLNIYTIFSFIFHWLKGIKVYLFYFLVMVNNDAMNGSWKGRRCHIDILSSYSFHRYQMWVAGSCEVLLKFQSISSGIFSKGVFFFLSENSLKSLRMKHSNWINISNYNFQSSIENLKELGVLGYKESISSWNILFCYEICEKRSISCYF